MSQPGPIRALIYVHEALRAAAVELEAACNAAGAPAEVESFGERLREYTYTARGHAVAEDKGYFPTLSERAPNVADAFAFDHDDEAEHLAELDRLSAGCTDAELPELKRLMSQVRAQMDLHMRKEETILWPLTEKLFSPPEQGAMVQQILAAIPAEDMPKLIPWIVDQLDVELAGRYVDTLAKVQPAEVFARTVEWIRSGCVPARVVELGDRLSR
jgi:hypothetical protein